MRARRPEACTIWPHMTSLARSSLTDDVGRELSGPPQRRSLRPGFERRVAAGMSARLAAAPGALEAELRMVLAIETELAQDSTCSEAHRDWAAFVELLLAKWGRAHQRAGQAASVHQDRALGTVDQGLRRVLVTPKPTDVPANPFARFALQARATTPSSKRAGGPL